jgi:hypothetical protein
VYFHGSSNGVVDGQHARNSCHTSGIDLVAMFWTGLVVFAGFFHAAEEN